MTVNKKKKIIVLVLVLLCTIFLGLSYKSLSNGIPLDSVKLSKEDRKRFAIKIEDNNGDYIDYNGDTWPGVGYILNIEESKCTTKNGEVINNILEYSNYVVKVTTKKSVFCYLYFDQGYVVAFNTNGGSSIESITVPKSGTAVVSRPENPTKSGKGLVRWEQSTCSEYDFSTPITGNITLNAVWGDAHNVTFSTNGGTTIQSQVVGDGGTVVRPENPTKSGYTFEKWVANGREYNFDREVKKNLNLIAVFRQNRDLNISLNTTVTNSKYNIASSCANSTWNSKYRRLEFSNLGSGTTNCTLSAGTNANLGTLLSVVESNTINENSSFMGQNDFTFVSVSRTASNGDSLFTRDETKREWTFHSELLQSLEVSDYVTYIIRPTNTAKYRICFSEGGSAAMVYAFYRINSDGSVIPITSGKYSAGCKNYSDIAVGSESTLKIEIMPRNQTPASFSIQSDDDSYDVGYRYEGKNPNNYIWFNNEYWRIIGSIPTKVDSSGTIENRVKIIRNDSLRDISWNNVSSASAWNQSSLYRILNTYYYGSDGSRNGTNDSGCRAYLSPDLYLDCNFEGVGINPSGYYGRMIQNAYWNTGTVNAFKTPKEVFAAEKSIQAITGRVGIMNVSDYGYGSTTHSGTMANYYGTISENWLFKSAVEWTININSSNEVFYEGEGTINDSPATTSFVIRPVVYLDPSVYVVSGDGSAGTPYQIAM